MIKKIEFEIAYYLKKIDNENFFSHDIFNVTLCLEYTSNYLFSPLTSRPSPSYIDPI